MSDSRSQAADPYQTPAIAPAAKPEAANGAAQPISRWRFALAGARWAVLSAVPISGLMGLLFRFPVPFVGYVSGIEAVLPSMLASLFYGIGMGGFILLLVVGGMGGVAAGELSGDQPTRQRRNLRFTSLGLTTACVFVLAILDKIIGPW